MGPGRGWVSSGGWAGPGVGGNKNKAVGAGLRNVWAGWGKGRGLAVVEQWGPGLRQGAGSGVSGGGAIGLAMEAARW